MNEVHDLELLIKSRVPVVAVESLEELRVLDIAARIAWRQRKPVYKWTITEGLQALDSQGESQPSVSKPIDVLGHIKTKGHNSLFILVDYHHYLKEPVHIRLLKDIAITHDRHRCTVMLLSHQIDIPEELRRFSGRFDLPLPNREALRKIVYEVAGEWGAEHGQRSVEASNKSLELLIRNLAGLTASDARRLARNAIYDDGAITYSDLPDVMKAKYELLGQDGVLSFEYETARFSQVGGLSRLKTWVDQRKDLVHNPGDSPQLDPPKGILLLGVQGCGKSLAAKAIAGIFNVPLLRLDFGALYNKYHGETERNLRESLSKARVMSPCVLWMDEIEKGLSTSDSDGGTSRRVLGTFLTWMAEKDAAVFMVATANDIQALPPELIRKGRFDEIFFVDLPSAEVRREIFKIHLQKREYHPVQFDLDQLAQASDGFSGSEIEQALVSALYSARAQATGLSTALLLQELHNTRPLSVVMAEQIQGLRDWASERTVPCD